jgi:hypothetical protein
MQFHKQQRQPKVAVSPFMPFMMHATRKAAHQVNTEIAHFRPRATLSRIHPT